MCGAADNGTVVSDTIHSELDMLVPNRPAVILAPMEGLTDAPMRSVQSAMGAFTFAVSEFLRVSGVVPPKKVFLRQIPELAHGARTPSGLPVHVQLLGGHPGRMAQSALVAVKAGAKAIDINFGCPAPTVNRHDGGATLLKHPARIREIVAEIRAALPPEIPVSAKLRLGWDTEDAIFENAEMAAEGGAAWVTIHGRTRQQGYKPPAYWWPIGIVRERLSIPVVANGDLWTIADFRRCREETGCEHYMLGRCALANPLLSYQVSHELGLIPADCVPVSGPDFDWRPYLQYLVHITAGYPEISPYNVVCRLKQWLKLASLHGEFAHFDTIKRAKTVEEILASIGN